MVGVVRFTVAERFHDKWIGEPNSGCWLWTGNVSEGYSCMYGTLYVNGRTIRAHRVSYTLYKGEIPSGMIVMHRCDTPLCVNPDHLSIGTNADNNADMDAKGRRRAPRGEYNGHAKLTADDVATIRASSARSVDLAGKYGVTIQNISSIRRRKSWKWAA